MKNIMRRSLVAASLIVLTVVLSSCGYFSRDAQFGDTAAFNIDQAAFLVCSSECRAQGQCGTLAENAADVVFINQGSIVTRNHNGLLGNNTAVTVREVTPRTLLLEEDNTQRSQMNFFRVSFQNPDGNPGEGWVAGWCLADSGAN